MEDEKLLPCQKAVMILFECLPQQSKMYKALEKDKKLQAELDQVFIKARDELNKIYPVE